MLTKQMKHNIRAAFRRWNQRPDWLVEKARLKAHIEACTEDGKIAVIRSGMDCDCTQYLHQTHIPAPTLMAWQRAEEEHERWLDGPCNTWIGKPSDYPKGYASSDRALEAYEDGHPSRVEWTSLSIGDGE